VIYSPPFTGRQLREDFELRDLLLLDHSRAVRALEVDD